MDCYKGGCIPPGEPRPPPPPEQREGTIKVDDVDAPALAKHDSSILDLAFVMDCTGSMSSHIQTAQQNIRKIVEEIVAKEKSDIHLALVEYRDHPPEDMTFVVREHDFTPSVKTMKSWLDAASAEGVADAWHALLKLSWRAEATKIAVHVADAPPHGLSSNSFSDRWPEGCPDGLDPVVIMNQLAQKGVTLYMVGCEPSINTSKHFFMTMAHITGGQYVPLTNARLLTQVIIGGAEEELSLEALMAEVEEQVRRERDAAGGDLDEEELSRRVHTMLADKGVQVKQLARQNEAMPEMPAWAGKMAKNPTLAAMSSALKDEGLIDNAPEPPAAMGGCMGMPMACPPMMMSCPPPPPPGGMASMPITLETIPPPSSPAMMGGMAPEPGDSKVGSSDGMKADGYSVQSGTVNMAQAQRLVTKALNRMK